jgi:hypothetical protein
MSARSRTSTATARSTRSAAIAAFTPQKRTSRGRGDAVRHSMTPFRWLEIAIIAACGLAAPFREVDAALAAFALVAALELMRSM